LVPPLSAWDETEGGREREERGRRGREEKMAGEREREREGEDGRGEREGRREREGCCVSHSKLLESTNLCM
jgi:hypothetical protein